jgi:hypothetical protein
MIFLIKLYFLNNLVKYVAYACPEVSNASKNPIAIGFSYQLNFKQFITKEKMS